MSSKFKADTMICKFDNEIECSFYLCEEDCSNFDRLLEMGKRCPLFDKEQQLLLENKALKTKIFCVCAVPAPNKHGMDNSCAKCGKVIEPRKKDLMTLIDAMVATGKLTSPAAMKLKLQVIFDDGVSCPCCGMQLEPKDLMQHLPTHFGFEAGSINLEGDKESKKEFS